MKVSLKWIGDYIDIKLPAEQLAERLTLAGLEVEAIQRVGGTWHNIVIGEVLAVSPHPNADRLSLATVDLGTEQYTVVCGAPNIGPGQKVPFARIGARLIDGHTGQAMSLKAARIRGVVSEGMVCSEKELGISDNHEEILVLPLEAPLGTALDAYLGDVILELDVTPNRPDCLSVIGIAREVAALTGEQVRLTQPEYEELGDLIDSLVSVHVVEPGLCPRYCAGLLDGIKVASSPGWLQQRLISCGMRPINNVVDVTNYVMLEYGQPLHAFDFGKIKGGEIVVRNAVSDETITTLDEVKRSLDSDVLVIADGERAVAVAGIIGGSTSEVTEATEAVLLESANFDQSAIRRGCNHLRVQSEASIRFDKGLNSELPLIPLRRATQLLLELAGGRAARGVVDVYPGKAEPKRISLTTRAVERLSGLQVSFDEIGGTLRSLGFECQESKPDSRVSVSVPYWRSDITCSADLVEEVIRIIGYDKVPITRVGSPLPRQRPRLSTAELRRNLRDKIRNVLTGFGFQEILNYSLVSLEKLQKLSPGPEMRTEVLKVANPMTREQEYLRTTLRAGLLATLSHNQKHETTGIRLFEIDKVFLPRGKDLPEEKEMLCAVLSGSRLELSWCADDGTLDFFDAKGIVESLLNGLGLEVGCDSSEDETLLQGRAASIVVADDDIGVFGELHPKVAEAFELTGNVYVIEVDLERLLARVGGMKAYQAVPRFPSVTRDIAVVLDEGVSYRNVEEIVCSYPLVVQATLFDLYRGDQVPAGKKSFAVRIVYQSPSHTLTDAEVDHMQQQMLDRLRQELGATLR
ncbi:MAG: phenylalanine--tRNA ligase subunit beta [Dehalococcoidia bacterium]